MAAIGAPRSLPMHSEALFAAVFLDGGLEAARAVISRLYRPMLDGLDNRAVLWDPKTALQEWLQGRRKPFPVDELAQVRGEAHAQEFEVSCVVDNPTLKTVGVGPSRRAAEQQAALGCAAEAARKK